MFTYQDYLNRKGDVPEFIISAINDHKNDEDVKQAQEADLYDHQRNVTINEYVRTMYNLSGGSAIDWTAANAKIASNFFHRLNTQRNEYLLGNGVQFTKSKTKKDLGEDFDTTLQDGAYWALIHKVSFGFWNVDKLYFFPYTEFVPLYDEETGALRAGIRYWQLNDRKPLIVIFYEEDGYTKYMRKQSAKPLEVVTPKTAYRQTIAYTEDGGDEVIGETNYSTLPIIPLWGSKLKQSTLVGMKEMIDSYDLIRSGFANDLTDCAQIYWLIENSAGMTEDDLARFRDRMKIQHIVTAETSDGARVTPYTQDIPFQARQQYLDAIRSEIYESFGALDVHTIAASSTNDHIDAAYQPMDEEADDFEYQVTSFIKQLLKLIGDDDEPIYKRNRISNQAEQTQMVMSAAEYLDEETILSKLPFITVDEVQEILKRKDAENMERMGMMAAMTGGGVPSEEQSEEGQENDQVEEESGESEE